MPDNLRAIFNEDAELYHRARPGYPADLFLDLGDLADIGPGARVVEIGPGTGQATVALAAQGARVVAVELGTELARVLEHNLAGAAVEVVVSAFEDWTVPGELFDTVVAFTAWHWLDPATRTSKAGAALHPGGALATVTTFHVRGGTEAFFADVQSCYQQWNPATPPDRQLLPADMVPAVVDEVDHSELFGPAVHRRYQQDVRYTTNSYLQLLGTYSTHRVLSEEQRHGLFTCIAQLIDQKYSGTIVKRYLYELRVARRHVVSQRVTREWRR